MQKHYKIQYILRYYEEKDCASEIIKANSEEDALIKFAKKFKINNHKLLDDPMFMWEDGKWMANFKCINEVEETTCPQCEGNGIIHLDR